MPATPVIIETSDNRFFEVIEYADRTLAHCWKGMELRRNRKTGEFTYAKNANWQMVRKAAARIVRCAEAV